MNVLRDLNETISGGRAHLAGEATAYTNFVISKCLAKDSARGTPVEVFAARCPGSAHLDVVRRTAVSPGTVTGWGGSIAPVAPLAAGFAAYIRPRTIIGRLAGFRVVPLNVSVARVTSGTTAYWIGDGKPTPLSAMALDAISLPPAKIGGICVVTRSLAQASDPAAVTLIRNDLAAAVTQLADTAFIDPARAGTPGVSPPSVTYGAPTVASTGATADAFAKDFTALVALIDTGLVAPYLVMRPTMAVALAGLNIPLTKNAGIGGDIGGIPIVTSKSAPANTVVLIDASEILLAEGPIELDTSDAANLEMTSTPTDPPVAATVLISLFQQNLFAIRAIQFINWLPARTGAVATLTGLAYGP